MTQASQADKATQIAWKRADIAGAGISIDQHPEWATLEADHQVYQRFSNEGTVSVRWGDDATIADVLAHVGLEGGAKRTIERDEPTKLDGIPARRVRLRVISADARAHDVRPSDRQRIFVFVGLEVGATHVLVGYRSPASELAAAEPLLEHVIASVRTR